jgi:hypothetical protein
LETVVRNNFNKNYSLNIGSLATLTLLESILRTDALHLSRRIKKTPGRKLLMAIMEREVKGQDKKNGQDGPWQRGMSCMPLHL